MHIGGFELKKIFPFFKLIRLKLVRGEKRNRLHDQCSIFFSKAYNLLRVLMKNMIFFSVILLIITSKRVTETKKNHGEEVNTNTS